MDPALWELTEGAADEEIRAIIRLHDGEAVPEHVRIVARFGNIATVQMQRGQIIEVHSAANVASLKARRFVVPDDEIMSADEEPASAELFTSRRPHEATETGQGVIVGCADWGVDFAHPDFRRADGNTRLLALWDRRRHSTRSTTIAMGMGRSTWLRRSTRRSPPPIPMPR